MNSFMFHIKFQLIQNFQYSQFNYKLKLQEQRRIMQDIKKDERIRSIEQKLKMLTEKKGIVLKSSAIQQALEKKKQKEIQPQIKTEKLVQGPQEDKQTNLQKTKKIKKQEKGEKKQENEKETHNLRKVAGIVWQDKTMEEWPDNDYRIFVGNLGNETTDQILSNVFRSRYPSFNMARVVRDRRTGKSRGYGFVSFSQPRDFLNSLKQMNGQYIGNRPAKVIKSNWKDRDINSAQNQVLPSDFKKNSKKQTNKIFTDYKYVHPY